MFPLFSRMFPSTNLQDLNLDWICRRIMELSKGIIAPWINKDTLTWMQYDTETEEYVDTGISASGVPGPAGPQGPAGPRGPAGGVVSVNGQTGAVNLNAGQVPYSDSAVYETGSTGRAVKDIALTPGYDVKETGRFTFGNFIAPGYISYNGETAIFFLPIRVPTNFNVSATLDLSTNRVYTATAYISNAFDTAGEIVLRRSGDFGFRVEVPFATTQTETNRACTVYIGGITLDIT